MKLDSGVGLVGGRIIKGNLFGNDDFWCYMMANGYSASKIYLVLFDSGNQDSNWEEIRTVIGRKQMEAGNFSLTCTFYSFCSFK